MLPEASSLPSVTTNRFARLRVAQLCDQISTIRGLHPSPVLIKKRLLRREKGSYEG